jgi:hypothetical protein
MTDADLARQLVAYVDATTEPVANPAIRRNGQPIHQTPSEMETIMLTEERTEETSSTKRPIGWLLLAAAAIAAIVAGFVITSSSSDEEPAPADQPAPTPAVTTTPDDDPSAQSPDLAADAAIGDEFMAALAALDAEAAAGLFSADASGDYGPGLDDFDATFRWYEASGFRFEPEDCRAIALRSRNVVCVFTQANMWSDAAGVDPVTGQVSMTVENGEITDLNQTENRSWFTLVTDPFYEYVLENHPDDAALLWPTDSTGEGVEPVLDDRYIELLARRSAEYLEAMAAES